MFAAIRSLIASLSLIVPLLFIKRQFLLDKTHWKYAIYTSLTYTVLGFGGMFLADGKVLPGLATVLANTQPLIAACLAYFFLQERLDWINLFGIALGFLGIVVIASPHLFGGTYGQSFTGILFVMAGTIGTGAGNVVMKRASKHCDPFVLTGLQLFIGSLILSLLSILFEEQSGIHWHTTFIWSLFVLAIPGTSFATVLWIYLLRKSSLSKLNVFTFLTPFFAIIIGILYFEETFSVIEVIGAGLALLGIHFTIKQTQPKTISNEK